MKTKKTKIIAITITAVFLISGSALAFTQTNIGQALENIAANDSANIYNVKNFNKTQKNAKLALLPQIAERDNSEEVATEPADDSKYIDIDISKQTLYAYNDGKLVKSFLISSGTYGRTPLGTFNIYSRSRSALMKGPGYYLPNVQWVNRFVGHFSIHGTYWHHNFGHPMSHGCVNASNADAQFIYTWAPMGTKVIIHN